MSGAELVAIIGLTASIAQLIDSTKKIIDRVKQYKRGTTFEDILPQLELFLEDVSKAGQRIASYEDGKEDSSRTFSRVLGGCNRQLAALNEIITSMTPSETSSNFRRSWIGLKSFGKDAKIREAMATLDRYRAALTLHMISDLTHQQLHPSQVGANSANGEGMFEIPRRRVGHFVGREGLLQGLKDFFLVNRESVSSSTSALGHNVMTRPQIAVLVGLGGQGKTQIALELCRQCANSFGTIIWINASSRTSALLDVKKIVKRLSPDSENHQDAQDVMSLFHQWLRGLKSPWMLVFDNYDDPSSFRDIADFYLDSGAIVITSRHPSSKRLGTVFEVGAMTDEEGVELLLRGIRRQDQCLEPLAKAKEVVANLGHLALAIDQAASYLSARQMPLQTFVEVFESRKKAILAHIPATWEYQTGDGRALSAFTTWELSVRQIASDDANRESITDFLTLVAFLDSSSVKESLFSTYIEQRPKKQQNQSLGVFLSQGEWDSANFQDLVMSLVDLALVQYVEYDDGYLLISLHPVIKDWLQLRIASSKQERMVQDTVDILAIYMTANDAIDLPYRTRAALLKHIDASQLNVTRFLKTMDSLLAHGGFIQGQQAVFATFYGKHDRTTDAEALFVRVLQIQRRYLGPSNIGTLATTNNLAGLYLRLQRYEEAETLLRRVLEGKEKLFGAGDDRITNTVNELGNVCSQLGRCEEAKRLYLRNLESFSKNPYPAINSLKIVYNNLGEVAMRQGSLEEAQQMFEKASALGKNNRPTCWSSARAAMSEVYLDEIDCQILINNARLFKCKGLFDVAAVTYNRAAQGLVTLLGPKHSKALGAQKEINDLFELRRRAPDPSTLRHSQNCDLNPEIRGACANWGSAMLQSQMLRLGEEKQEIQKNNSLDRTQQGTPLQSRRNKGQARSNTALPICQQSLLNQSRMSNIPRGNEGVQAPQMCFPFSSDVTTETAEAEGGGAPAHYSS